MPANLSVVSDVSLQTRSVVYFLAWSPNNGVTGSKLLDGDLVGKHIW